MSSTRTPAYRLELTTAGTYVTPMEWRTRATARVPAHGPTTDEALAMHIDFITAPGFGLDDVTILSARIVDQRTSQVVATYERAA